MSVVTSSKALLVQPHVLPFHWWPTQAVSNAKLAPTLASHATPLTRPPLNAFLAERATYSKMAHVDISVHGVPMVPSSTPLHNVLPVP